MNSMFSAFIKRLRDNRRTEFLVYAAIAASAAVIFFAAGGISCSREKPSEENARSNTESRYGYSEYELENRLKAILEEIEGAGSVSVLITFESGSRIIPAEESQVSQGSGESRRPVTVSNGGSQEPIILAELTPSVRGVIIVARGASDPRVKDRLRTAAVTALGTEPEKVSVFPMN